MNADRRGAEQQRLDEADTGTVDWRGWGPYLAERAWGTVREDYSADGDAWRSFPHDHARSRAYRWNEDGMAGFCDDGQDWCLALALWNGADPILKERMFGLGGPEGNHGEDVKEYWWHVDATPTHSWNVWRYHYPQRAFPYDDLVATNASRSRTDPEYELADTGVFDDDRYWVVEVTYAKAAAHDLLMEITVENAGPDPAELHVLPTLWFRNRWSWGAPTSAGEPRPSLRWTGDRVVAESDRSGRLVLAADGEFEPLFCANETNTARLYGATDGPRYPKDGIADHVLHGTDSVDPSRSGTKAALHHRLRVGPGERRTVRLRLQASPGSDHGAVDLGDGFAQVITDRRAEADAFWSELAERAGCTGDRGRLVRSALSGLLWSKQFYHYDVATWLDGDPAEPRPPARRGAVRNGDWRQVSCHDVIVMPDVWEYPWFAVWDWAFHCVTLAHVDPALAKAQLILALREWYLHPTGMLPAYEWDFSDVNPPVHAWAALTVFLIDGGRDTAFLARVFHKLLINFTWWVATKDHGDNNLFEGGFLGLDNIAPLNRSAVPPELGTLEQSDATAWMAFYALTMLDIAITLCGRDRSYEDVATKFFEQFLTIAGAANNASLWHPEDGFYYDVLHLTDGTDVPLRVKSLVGLIPVTAVSSLEQMPLADLPDFTARADWFTDHHPELAGAVQRHPRDGVEHRLLALVDPDRLRTVLAAAFDEAGMLSAHGIRSVSAWHREHPFRVELGGVSAGVDYEPGESTTALFGGNSNWRGPVWMPLNVLLVEALRRYDEVLGADFTVEYPTGSGRRLRLHDVADDLAGRLAGLFLPGPDGVRPSDTGSRFATDPRWNADPTFSEYFHGDTGAGLGASHQTGWTALVAHLLLTRHADDPVS
ncbi:hypothetical protein FHX74_002309 [Friedmanniella endophytica]|uniref:Mannosylglycerate hydrolase MGH1-like glycoside hydrolase domain-containing protein n=1 Tax=Microlunatus kandeliicorticis TaxID=1759536 RepID=A0A7W3IT17_9ACTN|nr:glucosidase [Microlunatus kandeliicorticis]MBA8794690.1 hypothetical protein [Microlunatus kandeliicorticis]